MSPVRGAALLTAIALAAVYVVWGSTYLAIAIGLESIPPLLLMGTRSVVAGGVLYGAARLAGAPAPDAAAWRNALLVGVLFFVVGHGLLSWGETRVPSGAAAVVIATEPLFIVLLGWRGGVLAGGRVPVRPGGRVIAAVLIGLVGVGAMMLPGAGGSLDALGVGALVAASLSWSIGTYHVSSGGSPLRAAGMQLLLGGAILLVLSGMLGEMHVAFGSAITLRSLGALLYLIVFGSVITFGAYIWLLRRIGPARVATHTFVNPVIALGLGAWLGGETLGATTLLASVLVLTAVVLLLTARPQGAERGARAPVRMSAPTQSRAA
jgi:drug/metabolite transporter (DMT)-like permease